MSDEKKLFLLDGMALVYRGHFALMRNPRMTSQGMNTSAVFAFANTLLSIIDREEPTHIAAVFDTPEPTHRHKAYAEYKAQREAMPEDLSQALPYVFQLCEAFNMPVLKMPGWEADDIIGTLALRAEGEGFNTYMVTPAKDYGQLVSEQTVIYKPGRAGDEAEIQGVREILDRWSIERIAQVVDILGLMGDASDNIPGVPGIGEKTAQKLIARFGSVEGVLAGVDELKGKQKENVQQYRDQALLSKELVTIERDVPIEQDWDAMGYDTWDRQKLAALFVELEFNTLGKRVLGEGFAELASGGQAGPPVELMTIADVAHNVAGIQAVMAQLESLQKNELHIVFGMVSDKDFMALAPYLPTTAVYYFCSPKVVRAKAATQLEEEAAQCGINGNSYPSVEQAFMAAQQNADTDDVIFVGGSVFTVAEVL